MEEWIDFDEVFFRHSSEAQDQQEHQDHEHGHEQSQGRALGRRMIMSIFQVKCALIALFGEEVPTRIIKEVLTRISPEWITVGVGHSAFRELAESFNVKCEQEIIVRAFREFDKLNKGYISAAEFKRTVSDLLPHLNPARVDKLFSAADMYQVEKVTFPQFKVLMQRLKSDGENSSNYGA